LFIWSILKVCKSQKLSLNNIFKIDHLVWPRPARPTFLT
jgi:hypothetical protein